MSEVHNMSKEPESVEHRIGKMVFVVTRVFREDSDKTIHDILLGWMKKDIETH